MVEMKSTKAALTVWILGLALLVSSHAHPPLVDLPFPKLPSPLEVLSGQKGAGLLGIDSQTSSFSLSFEATSASTSSLSSTSTSPSATTTLSTTTLEVSYPPRSSATNASTYSTARSTSESTTATSAAVTTSPDNGLGSLNPSFASDMSKSTDSMTDQRRTLIIVLSTVLGSVGIILIAAAIILVCRYRKGRAPFRHRGVTPINDDEIESWRGTEQKQQNPILEAGSTTTPRGMSIDSIALKHSPGWTWSGSPGTLHSINSPAANLVEPPSFVARAPNSRVGLTDEAIPGADAFIPTPKRQSSRLSKDPPGHSRTKSRKSSISAKSVRSYTGGSMIESKSKEMTPAWYDPDSESVGTGLRDTNSSPGTSIFDGLNAGGLSPRPKSKSQLRQWENPEDIGRAIA